MINVTIPEVTSSGLQARFRTADGSSMGNSGTSEPTRRRVPPIWIYVVALGAVAATGGAIMWSWQPIIPNQPIPWWVLVLGFAAGERLVLHIRLRRDAHSFSMSEIPLVIALFLASPIAAMSAQLVANGVVLTLHRRQTPVKLAFNLAQFAIQTMVAYAVFRAALQPGIEAADPLAWAAALVAALAALAAADLMINGAIAIAGGSMSRKEIWTVFVLGALGTIMSTSLALVIVTLYVLDPSSVILGMTPPFVLFVAYRAYLREREEGERLEALYDATRALHASPQIEAALSVAVATAREMVESEYAEVFLFPTDDSTTAYRTSNGPDTDRRVMRPLPPKAVDAMRHIVGRVGNGLLVGPIEHEIDHGPFTIHEAVVVPLAIGGQAVGIMLVANPLGDVASFGPEDVRLLETVASQVSISLENGRLEHSLTELSTMKERLEELVKSKDQLVASVSHELRTPLTAVVGLAQELRANGGAFSADETAEFMALIAEQSSELADMIDDLLVAARAEAGSLSLNTAYIDLESELTSLLGQLRRGDSEPIPVEVDGAPAALADAMRTRQIIRNLISNAERYGGDRIWIENDEVGRRVVVAVADNGPGVPTGSEESIFEPFERAEGGVAHPLSVGLGLAVSRKLARLMGGDLIYQREDGITRFELILPAARQAAIAS
jgi:signal transduction histidine kinase